MTSRAVALAAALLLSTAALAQTGAPAAEAAPEADAALAKPVAKKKTKAKAEAKKNEAIAEADKAAAPAPAPAPAPVAAPAAPAAPAIDPDEFRRQVMEEVRKELQKTKDEVKQETSWVEADSTARVQDSEAVEKLKQSVNLFQPHGYFRIRPEFYYDMNLGRGADPAGYTLFPQGFINSGNNKSTSDANMRFRFDPTFMISEDIQIHMTSDILDNVLLGSSPTNDPVLDQYTPLASLTSGRAGVPINIKRVWARVNTQLGEFTGGRMGYHFGLGILHNDGNCLDCDYGDTYDRLAFSPREFKGHKLTVMMDFLDSGVSTTGEYGDLGRSVSIDTLDTGTRYAVEVLRVDTPDEARRKLEAGDFVINYGATVDYRVQGWDTPNQVPVTTNCAALGISGGYNINDSACLETQVVQRAAKIYQPDAFFSLRKDKFKIEAEVATTFGGVGTRANVNVQPVDPTTSQPIAFNQVGAAIQSQLAFLPADALLAGLDAGGASGDQGVYGFGARPWRSGTGNVINLANGTSFNATAPGDIDGPHFNFPTNGPSHGDIHNFVFNRAFNVDMILWRNLVTSVTSGWYIKPSIRYRPTGRKGGGGDDTGFEITAAVIYSQAWYADNTPGQALPLGLEANLGVSYDTADKLHIGVMYGVLLPFSGLGNSGVGYSTAQTPIDGSIAHAVRGMIAIPF